MVARLRNLVRTIVVDFSKISPPPRDTRSVDPIELFQQLKVSDPEIKNLWLGQGDALRKWHEKRQGNDVGIVLNTGAGKTLVGLLIAQSLVNETKGKVLYACSSIQLVEQTAEKATGYGFEPSTYVKSVFSSDSFTRRVGPCITTYHALFNGRSVFFDQEISAVIFDDAHTAEQLLRDSFSLNIAKSSLQSLYGEVLELFTDYFVNIGKSASLREITDGTGNQLLFVHPSEVLSKHEELIHILHVGGVQSSSATLFSWEHIKDHVNQCCVIVSATEITITPPFVPITTLSYFSNTVRRVYLSATLEASDAFARTFGRVPSPLVTPTTPAGECERLVLIPSFIDDSRESLASAKEVIDQRKALISVPTYSRAEEWSDIATPPPREHVSEHVKTFKLDDATPKLLLTSRYDGVDLPGESCRLMVIDDLPMGAGPLERYLWESLGMNDSLRSTIASRLIQSFGRISRGMTDHGVVLLTGKRLLEWLLDPSNTCTLPSILQKQISLGYQVSGQLSNVQDVHDAIDACFMREQDWLYAYEEYMHQDSAQKPIQEMDNLLTLAKAEVSYAEHAWKQDFEGAAQAISKTKDQAYSLSTENGAWHTLWLGYAQERLGDRDAAAELYRQANSNQTNIPPIRRQHQHVETKECSPQVLRISKEFRISSDGRVSLPKSIDTELLYLDGSGTSNQTEEALRALGKYLGLVATRPDNDVGTGPDVLWVCEDGPTLCIDAKTDKKTTSTYNKKDIGQMFDHLQWVDSNTDSNEVMPLFVGPLVKVSSEANPPDNFRVSTLLEFCRLGNRLKTVLYDVSRNALGLSLTSELNDAFDHRGLKFPHLLELLELRKVRNL